MAYIAPKAQPFRKKSTAALGEDWAAIGAQLGVQQPKPTGNFLQRILAPLMGIGSIPDVIYQSSYKGKNPFETYIKNLGQGFSTLANGELPEEGLKTTADLLERSGAITGKDFGSNAARGVLGFIGDVALDPTTYLTFGTAGLGVKGAKTVMGKLGKETVESLAKQGLEKEITETLATKGLKGAGNILNDTGLMAELGDLTRAARGIPLERTMRLGLPFTNIESRALIKNQKLVKLADIAINPIGAAAAATWKYGVEKYLPDVALGLKTTAYKLFDTQKYFELSNRGPIYDAYKKFTNNIASIDVVEERMKGKLITDAAILAKSYPDEFRLLPEYIQGSLKPRKELIPLVEQMRLFSHEKQLGLFDRNIIKEMNNNYFKQDVTGFTEAFIKGDDGFKENGMWRFIINDERARRDLARPDKKWIEKTTLAEIMGDTQMGATKGVRDIEKYMDGSLMRKKYATIADGKAAGVIYNDDPINVFMRQMKDAEKAMYTYDFIKNELPDITDSSGMTQFFSGTDLDSNQFYGGMIPPGWGEVDFGLDKYKKMAIAESVADLNAQEKKLEALFKMNLKDADNMSAQIGTITQRKLQKLGIDRQILPTDKAINNLSRKQILALIQKAKDTGDMSIVNRPGFWEWGQAEVAQRALKMEGIVPMGEAPVLNPVMDALGMAPKVQRTNMDNVLDYLAKKTGDTREILDKNWGDAFQGNTKKMKELTGIVDKIAEKDKLAFTNHFNQTVKGISLGTSLGKTMKNKLKNPLDYGKIYTTRSFPKAFPVDEGIKAIIKEHGGKMTGEEIVNYIKTAGEESQGLYENLGFDGIIKNNTITAFKSRAVATLREDKMIKGRDIKFRDAFGEAIELEPQVADLQASIAQSRKDLKKLQRDTTFYAPKETIAIMKGYTDSMTGDDVVTKVFSTYDKIVSWWKGLVTGRGPAAYAYHTKNMIGDTELLIAGGANVKDLPKNIEWGWLAGEFEKKAKKEGLQAVIDNPQVNKVITQFAGQDYRISDLYLDGLKTGITSSTQIADEIGKQMDITVMQGLKKGYEKGKSKFNEIVDKITLTDLGRQRENAWRSASLLDAMKKVDPGVSIEQRILEASPIAKMRSLDYSNLTPFEKNFAKRIIPFYSFFKQNIKAQMNSFVTNPKVIATQIKFFDAIQTTFGENMSQEEWDSLPEWMRTGLTFALSKNASGDVNVLTSFGDPLMQLNSIIGGGSGVPIGTTIKKMISASAPFLKIPLEMSLGYDTFRDQAIDTPEGRSGFSYQNVTPLTKAILGYQEIPRTTAAGVDYTDRTVDPNIAYLMGNLPLIGQASLFEKRLSKVFDPKNTPGDTFYNALPMLTGVRTYERNIVTEQAARKREMDKKIQDELFRKGMGLTYSKFYLDKKTKAKLKKLGYKV